MTTMTQGSMVRQPAHELYDHAARLLATARALEAAARSAPAGRALGPTLACVEASLEALAHAAEQLSGHALDKREVGRRDELSSHEAKQRFAQLVAALTDAQVACAASRMSASPVLDAGASH
jgi:hypothetical protein